MTSFRADSGDLAARRLEARRAHVISHYEQRLRAAHSPLASDAHALSQALENAGQTLTEVILALREGDTDIARDGRFAENIGVARASRGIHPHESIRAAEMLSETLMSEVKSSLEDDPDALDLAMLAVGALDQVMLRRIRTSAAAYASYLLDAVHQEHANERARIARELHDHVGNAVEVAFRRLELAELHAAGDPQRSAEMVTAAKDGLQGTMEKMRLLIAGLRVADSPGIEAALRDYVDTVARGNVDITIRLSGDERRISDSIRGEVFLIVRETLHNAMAYANADTITAQIDVMPHELRAVVEDDGDGFDPDKILPTSTGLTSVAERLELLDGMSKIETIIGVGTRIEIRIPLPHQPL